MIRIAQRYTLDFFKDQTWFGTCCSTVDIVDPVGSVFSEVPHQTIRMGATTVHVTFGKKAVGYAKAMGELVDSKEFKDNLATTRKPEDTLWGSLLGNSAQSNNHLARYPH